MIPHRKEYVIILSREIDNSVDRVITWLSKFGHKQIIRITSEKKIKIKKVTLYNGEVDIILNIDKYELTLEEIGSFWIRNGYFSYNYLFETNDILLQEKVNQYLNNEWKHLNDYFVFLLSSRKKRIGNYKELVPNKLIQLYNAEKVGLKIPDTNIITSREQKTNKVKDYITKPIKDIFTFEKNKIGIATKTKVLSLIDNNESFFPSLLQSKIEKFCELRIYFFHNKFYSSAIFTNCNSEIDYRSEGNKGNIRIVPYNLPLKIKRKLKKLMKLLQIESGSIDMIVNEKMEHFYLEVNPVGYFDNISHICNYNIEKDIAQYLAS